MLSTAQAGWAGPPTENDSSDDVHQEPLEENQTENIFNNPQHPYTKELIGLKNIKWLRKFTFYVIWREYALVTGVQSIPQIFL